MGGLRTGNPEDCLSCCTPEACTTLERDVVGRVGLVVEL